MSKWDSRFMSMARLVASWSKDPSKKVGAVIVDSKNRVVSLGYNGPPRGVEDDPSVNRDTKLRRTIHAEGNAILFAQGGTEGCTLYVTHHPCGPCAAIIIQAGIVRVVIPDGEGTLSHRWKADICEAAWMLGQAGVTIETIVSERDESLGAAGAALAQEET